MSATFADRQGVWAFALGCVAVTAGVLLHLPMFLMGRNMHYQLAGMPMGMDMIGGMALIVGGVGVASYGLLPRKASARIDPRSIENASPHYAQLSNAHW
jgi:putative MFS transporter